MITIWNAVGASVKGTSHLKSTLPCQDASAYTVMESGVFLAAVSDGAGSASKSDLGAQQAVNQALLALYLNLVNEIPDSGALWAEVLREAFRAARDHVFRLPDTDGGEVRDYSCTLTLVIADLDWLVTGQIGDGLAVAQTLHGGLDIIAAPQRGEYADSTFFLTGDHAEDMFSGRVYRQGVDIEPVSAVALMTDGLTNLAIDRNRNVAHAPFFAPLLRFPAEINNQETAYDELYRFLSSDRVNSRTDDDKTLVLAARPDTTGLAAYYSL